MEVRLPYALLDSDAWFNLRGSACKLYIVMMSLCDAESTVEFGPSDASCLNKRTYYRALRSLLDGGFVEEVRAGSHGKKGIYDLTTLRWGSA